SGWVTEPLLDEIAGPLAVAARNAPWVVDEMADSNRAASAAGIAGTPAFQIGRTGGTLETVPLNSLGPEGIQPAIEATLAS
ncbi:MAG: hypothetical protein ACRDMK_04705, partial [Gaiellaceae bacterium]